MRPMLRIRCAGRGGKCGKLMALVNRHQHRGETVYGIARARQHAESWSLFGPGQTGPIPRTFQGTVEVPACTKCSHADAVVEVEWSRIAEAMNATTVDKVSSLAVEPPRLA